MKKVVFVMFIAIAFWGGCSKSSDQLKNKVSTPIFTPIAGSYATNQNVVISCDIEGAIIKYTLDGTVPTLASSLYLNPIEVSSTTLILAKAFKSEWTDSQMAIGQYLIIGKVAEPFFDPIYDGTCSEALYVGIYCTTAGATIYYTTDGTEPTEASTQFTSPFTSPISITTTTTLRAKAFMIGQIASNVSIAFYTFPTGTVTDIDGNVYQTLIIGNQEWMIENLKVTRYRNGDQIHHVIDNSTWGSITSGAFCVYNNTSPLRISTTYQQESSLRNASMISKEKYEKGTNLLYLYDPKTNPQAQNAFNGLSEELKKKIDIIRADVNEYESKNLVSNSSIGIPLADLPPNQSKYNANTYGNLYNWYAVVDTRGLAPEGWRVPSDDDIKQLEMALGMTQSQADAIGHRGTNQGSKIAGRADLWNDETLVNELQFDSSGFNFLPGGSRDYSVGDFSDITKLGVFWSTTENNSSLAWYRSLNSELTALYRNLGSKNYGFSVRCVRDVN